MNQNLFLYLFSGENAVRIVPCLSFSLEREVYTPFESVTAEYLADTSELPAADRIGIYLNQLCIFHGLVDSVQQYTSNHASFIRIKSRSFTSLLTQNELEPGLHSNLTIDSLMTQFYQFPYITYENFSGSGYIFVKSGNTMWDGVVSFGYKLTGHYPYILHNHICLSPPQNTNHTTFSENQVSEYGSYTDTTKLISHYHMEDINGTPNSYQQSNPAAAAFNIVRHKQIPFDRSFLHNPDDALTFRNLYSCRGCRAKYLVYAGFQNELLGHRITFGNFIQNQTVCRVQTTFGPNGFRTKLWCYQDGFYH